MIAPRAPATQKKARPHEEDGPKIVDPNGTYFFALHFSHVPSEQQDFEQQPSFPQHSFSGGAEAQEAKAKAVPADSRMKNFFISVMDVLTGRRSQNFAINATQIS